MDGSTDGFISILLHLLTVDEHVQHECKRYFQTVKVSPQQLDPWLQERKFRFCCKRLDDPSTGNVSPTGFDCTLNLTENSFALADKLTCVRDPVGAHRPSRVAFCSSPSSTRRTAPVVATSLLMSSMSFEACLTCREKVYSLTDSLPPRSAIWSML